MIRLRSSNIVIFACMFLLLRPQILLSMNENIIFLFTTAQLLAVVIIILKRRKICLDPIVMLGFVFYAYLMLNTVLQSRFAGYIYSTVHGVYGIVVIIYLFTRYGKEWFFEGISRSMVIYLVLNFMLTLLGVHGETAIHNKLAPVYFLGRDNQIAALILLGMLLQYMNVVINNKRGKEKVLPYILILLNLIYFSSATLVICMGILLIVLLVTRMPKFMTERITPATVTLALVLLFVIITVLQRMEFMADIFALLGKDMTLSARTQIWAGAFEKLASLGRFIFGYGEMRGGEYIKFPSGTSYSAHNLFLQLMLEGGVIALSLYIAMWVCAAKQIRRIGSTREKAVICSFVLVYFISCMTEVFPMPINVLVLHAVYLYSPKTVIYSAVLRDRVVA